MDIEDIFDGIEEEVLEGILEGMSELVNTGVLLAKSRCPPGNEGDLSASIHGDTEIVQDGIKGYVATNSDHAAFVEFGTGPIGRKTAVSKKYSGPITYKGEGWWISVGDGPGELLEKTANKYHFFIWKSKSGKKYAFTTGQAAQPFMYPTSLDMEEELDNLMNKYIGD